MSERPIAAIVLAAGKGSRMKSDLPKVLHRVCGVPMVEHVLRALRGVNVAKTVVVIGHGAKEVREELGDKYVYAVQDPPQGTGDAVRFGLDALGPWDGPIIVCYGDTPLVTEDVFQGLVAAQAENNAGVVTATVILPDATGYGRIIWEDGQVVDVIEEKNATDEQKLLREANAGAYCFDGPTLAKIVPQFSKENKQGEYLLTDAIKLGKALGKPVAAAQFPDPETFEGVNDRWALAKAEGIMRARINESHARNGVTFIDPATAYIGADVEIGQDAIIHPNVFLEGQSSVGKGSEIGPNTRIQDSKVGDRCLIHFSRISDSKVGDGTKIGPFANLRHGADLGEDVKIGNFVELKNAKLSDKVSVAHLTYLGDTSVGKKTNIGAGTITCNYDGKHKHKTVIGEHVFVGSNSTIIAPRTIGDKAMIIAGSIVNKDVGEGDSAGARAELEVREGGGVRWRKRKGLES